MCLDPRPKHLSLVAQLDMLCEKYPARLGANMGPMTRYEVIPYVYYFIWKGKLK